MTVAPSRIWAHGACMGHLGRPLEAGPSFHWGRWETRTGDPGHCTEYVRADIADAQAQEIARMRDALKDIEKADFTACPFDSPDCQVKPDEPCPVCGDQNTWDQISQCRSMGASAAARAALGETR